MKLPALPTPPPHLPLALTTPPPHLPLALTTPPPQDQMILKSMALVYSWSLPSVFLYFLHTTLFSLKIKNLSVKNRINHQKYVICFTEMYNK